MKLEDIRLAVSPLTDRVMMGTLRNEITWRTKRDATNDFCSALLTWCPVGTVRTINSSTGESFEVVVTRVTPSAAGEPKP